ncbi:hypothetical protein SDC9_45875 [bioreactor metagenome]|uniref:Lipocalin-like domain-containing protein n=1 Tax=bioreactor metagenome TaxID=1076179 RepID=A0A644W839_9ZZZZ
MKTKSIRNIIALALFLFTVTACSKFEDGPKISFRSKMKRIYGEYHIEYLSKNGADLTDYWNKYYDLSFKFYSPLGDRPDDTPGVKVYGEIDSCGYWKFYETDYEGGCFDDGSSVFLYMYNYIIDTTLYPNRYFYPLLIVGEDQTPVFEISRLSNDEMWITHTKGSDVYEIHFSE